MDYDGIAAVKQATGIPVIANGDIDTPEKARQVLARTGADGVMIGRAAQGRPWLPAQADQLLRTGECMPDPGIVEIREILRGHIAALHEFYGEFLGVRIARKHVCWTLDLLPGGEALKRRFNRLERPEEQFSLIDQVVHLEKAA